MVDYKKALQSLWTDKCSVYTYSKTLNELTKRTEFGETLLYSNIPCKLSFDSLATTNSSGDHVDEKTQNVKLFLDETMLIPIGSKVVVTRGKNTFIYKVIGSGIFHNHQEVKLTIFEGWA